MRIEMLFFPEYTYQMDRPFKRHAANKSCLGFNLIEAAIVLAVVGLVIGGIWAAAATLSFNSTVSDLTSGTTYHLSRARESIRGANQGFGWYCNGTLTGQMQNDMGLFPKNWIFDGSSGFQTNGVLVYYGCMSSALPEMQSIGIGFAFTPQQRALCRRLLVELVARDWQNINAIRGISGLSQIAPFGGNSTTRPSLTGPIVISDAGVDTICNANANVAFNPNGGPYLSILWRY